MSDRSTMITFRAGQSEMVVSRLDDGGLAVVTTGPATYGANGIALDPDQTHLLILFAGQGLEIAGRAEPGDDDTDEEEEDE